MGCARQMRLVGVLDPTGFVEDMERKLDFAGEVYYGLLR